ncbi:GPW/gp25 family protein [Azospirillum sp. Sh1]|uniref:GPW/gp25 family protein n=1 Tax=Azospirillum sp. Sh1 TaxID=2607285 RepID=UPI001FFE4943|nr:GPW/gp25 family protein [Azospirillum sp. Sh1]
MSATAGRALAGTDHLRQSIRDILTTPIGSRVELRDYGSNLFNLIDRPVDEVLKVDIIVATVDALRRWEPRLEVSRVEVESAAPGAITLAITGLYLPEGRVIRLDGITVQ